MITIANDLISLAIAADASAAVITDRKRGSEWTLERGQLGVRRENDADDAPLEVLPNGIAAPRGDAIVMEFALPEGKIEYTWSLGPDHVRLVLNAEAQGLAAISLPGAFLPASPGQAVLPVYQGVLSQPHGEHYQATCESGGHTNMSMAMGAMIAETAALLVTEEPLTDWRCTHGRNDSGPYFFFEQRHCPVDGWYEREVRLFPVDRDVTSIAKRYRQRVIERGEFKAWAEKIAEKPMLEKLFGALIAFVGYNRTDEVDYVESARRLKAYGFETVMYYSTRMCHYSLDFKMGGDDPIWLDDDQIAALKSIPDTLLAPWAWIVEALDDGSPAIRDILRWKPDGTTQRHWQIDDFKWYEVCTPYQIAHIKQRLATDMAAMDWLHFDVNAMRPGQVCFNKAHDRHDCQPMGRRRSLEFTRELFSPSTVGNRIVSSEGFVDRYAPYYDIGSTKVYPAWGAAAFIPIPLTMLVLHDSCVHDWWEVHNYNDHPGFREDGQHLVGANSCGRPEQKAAMDALYGCPPNLFPFGKQYSWVNRATRETYSYVVTLDDPETQRAIAAAKPVADLHRKIGKCELTRFEFLTDDYAVQATEFSDGTRIIANISNEDREVDQHGLLPANSWRELA